MLSCEDLPCPLLATSSLQSRRLQCQADCLHIINANINKTQHVNDQSHRWRILPRISRQAPALSERVLEYIRHGVLSLDSCCSSGGSYLSFSAGPRRMQWRRWVAKSFSFKSMVGGTCSDDYRYPEHTF